jgi:putative oxidoreductase
MKNFIPQNIVRILFALTMLFFASGHFMNAKPMADMMLKSWPMAEMLTYLSGVCLALAGIAFIINKQVKLAGYLLALLLVIIVIGVHIPGLSNPDERMKMMSMSSAVKDTAIAMGALAIANASEN